MLLFRTTVRLAFVQQQEGSSGDRHLDIICPRQWKRRSRFWSCFLAGQPVLCPNLFIPRTLLDIARICIYGSQFEQQRTSDLKALFTFLML